MFNSSIACPVIPGDRKELVSERANENVNENG
jgi:hypothetical protein